MVQWQFVCVLSFLTLIGCGDSDTGPDPSPVGDSNGINSSNASNNDEILRELRDQNKLLKEQSERLKEIDVAKDRSSEREKHIDTIAGSVAQLVNKHQQKIGRAINNAGGFASEKSAICHSMLREANTNRGLMRSRQFDLPPDLVPLRMREFRVSGRSVF